MKRRTRYLFIILGLVVFLTLGPLIVFYVSGIDYDWGQDQYVQTGIISVKTDPKNVTIKLDGNEVESTPVSIRFLSPREYDVTLSKTGYFDWSKRVDVKASKAIILSDGLDKIYLLKRNPESVVISTAVKDFVLSSDYIAYLTDSAIVVSRGKNYQTQIVTVLPGGITSVDKSGSDRYLLLQGGGHTLLFDVIAAKIADITAFTTTTATHAVTGDGNAIILRQSKLYIVNPDNSKTTILAEGVGSFQLTGNMLYYTQKNAGAQKLLAASLNGEVLSDPQTLVTDLPILQKTQSIYVTDNKDIAVLQDAVLYRINAHTEVVARDVQQIFFDSVNRTLGYISAGEFLRYDFNANASSLITRSGTTTTSPIVASLIGYAFYLQDQTLHAMELDAGNHQNHYQLGQYREARRLEWSADQKTLLVLDGSTLLQLTIR